MKYYSTRGEGESLTFEEALLTGLALDGGLYMPENWPHFDESKISQFAGQPFADVARDVLLPFVGEAFSAEDLHTLCQRAFSSFSHPAVTPLVQVGDEEWILELFHGPTLAFKDVAMQLLGEMFEMVLTRRKRSITIIGATSGDTGGAAIEALKNRQNIQVFILHPKGRISEVQRRIMTTSGAGNIINIAVNGTFDDCQAIVKTLFANREFVDEVNLGGVNSINWARIAIQVVYYFTAVAALGGHRGRPFSFVVPTGNFGDIFAGFVAQKMGLPIRKLCAATNQNDIIHRVLSDGIYEPAEVAATASPSMDIQVSSNFERLIFEASARDSDEVCRLMKSQKQSGGFSLPAKTLDKIKEQFLSEKASEEETAAAMREHHQKMGMIIDPHTAVGRVVTKKLRDNGSLRGPVITLATAHPAKFPESVIKETGHTPILPASMKDLYERTEEIIESDAEPSSIKSIILEGFRK